MRLKHAEDGAREGAELISDPVFMLPTKPLTTSRAAQAILDARQAGVRASPEC